MTLKKRKHYVPTTADCSNFYCPRLTVCKRGKLDVLTTAIRDMLQDATGRLERARHVALTRDWLGDYSPG